MKKQSTPRCCQLVFWARKVFLAVGRVGRGEGGGPLHPGDGSPGSVLVDRSLVSSCLGNWASWILLGSVAWLVAEFSQQGQAVPDSGSSEPFPILPEAGVQTCTHLRTVLFLRGFSLLGSGICLLPSFPQARRGASSLLRSSHAECVFRTLFPSLQTSCFPSDVLTVTMVSRECLIRMWERREGGRHGRM